MFGSYEDLDVGTQAIQSAYRTIVEKKKQKDEEELEQKLSKVEKELEKVADKINEELKESAFDIDKLTGKSTVSQAVMDRLHKATQEYHDFVTPEFLAAQMQKVLAKKFSVEDDKHKQIHKDNDTNIADGAADIKEATVSETPVVVKESTRQERLQAALKGPQEDQESLLKEALIEAMTDTDFEARAKVASSTKDADLLSAMAQNHMNENAPGATEICNHIARNPSTPKHIVEKLSKHSDPKVAATASSMLAAQTSGPTDISPVIKESFDNGAHILDLASSGRVAKAYAAGKALTIKSASTDGKSYTLHGNEIARKNDAGEHEFSWEGWYTPTTERHLNTILNQVAPGKRVQKGLHKKQGVERFTVKDLGE